MSRVIIVEDEGLVARSLAAMLAEHGYEVPACIGTGAAAVSAAHELDPDLVLMDIHLRGPMDGIEAARLIRRDIDVPIVFLSAYGDRAHLDRAKLTEPYAYLLKPYSDRELLTTIEVVIHRHRLERELKTRERWLGTTLRSIGDGVIAVGPDQEIRLMNAEAERLTGWSSAEALGRPLTEVLRVIAEDTRVPREIPLARAMDDGAILSLEGPTLLVDRRGAEVPVDDSVAAIADEHGHVLGGVVVFRDVTERRSMEERLALADRMASLATLTAGLGHELNNPLSYNLGNLDLVLGMLPALRTRVAGFGGHAGPPELAALAATLADIEERLTDARAGADRMRDIIGTLREFARPTGEDLAAVPIIDAIESAIRITDNETALRGQVIRDFKTAPVVRGHAGQLSQVFANLLINAAHALPERSDQPQSIVVSVDATEREVFVEVTDTGAGIPPEMMVRIFEPFFTTKPVGVGTGLGLAIVRHIIKFHHGDITVTSRLGHGSTFRIRLPRIQPEAQVTHAAASPATGRPVVLLVEDEPMVARMLRAMLELDHDVVVATSGRDAIEQLRTLEPDVIVSDLMMPEMTGIELHAHLQVSHPALAQRMLFLTGGAYTQATQAFVAERRDQVLLKPVSHDALAAAIAAVLTPRR